MESHNQNKFIGVDLHEFSIYKETDRRTVFRGRILSTFKQMVLQI